jgi:hypothetical protein
MSEKDRKEAKGFIGAERCASSQKDVKRADRRTSFAARYAPHPRSKYRS